NHVHELGDELLSDSFPYTEIQNGVLWEVEGKVSSFVYYNLQLHCVLLAIADLQWVVKGALDVDIGANPSAEGGGEEDEGVDDQVVKVVDIVDTFRLQEQPAFDKKQFVEYIKKYIKLLTPKLFVGESMHDDSTLVFAYYKDGATDPTFLYFGHGLKEVKC
ncbi:hypothetical protein C3L33_23443, partial [Rhododendron williamsianum]